MDLTFLIGHRGVGKTSLLKRLALYGTAKNISAEYWDLDSEIEKQVGQKIPAIFAQQGQKRFRELEVETLRMLVARIENSSSNFFIALGAGFSLNQLLDYLPPQLTDARVVWVRRSSDKHGRIFLDRPRLRPDLDPLADFASSFAEREARYRAAATDEFFIREGSGTVGALDPVEGAYFHRSLQGVGGTLTLLPVEFLSSRKLAEKLAWGMDHLELRTDLLSDDMLTQARLEIPLAQQLWSIRENFRGTENIPSAAWCDWDLALGACPLLHPVERLILSSHALTVAQGIAELSHAALTHSGAHLKLAPVVNSFTELARGHRWQQEAPLHRSFLPRSPEGRWSWYRLWHYRKSFLNFWREGNGSSPDQPTLLEWLSEGNRSRPTRNFGAVLGHPVAHSFSPVEHGADFAACGASFWAIDVQSAEWDTALPFLTELGLRWAAVTSPLKKLAGAGQAANTLWWKQDKWQSANTDEVGFQMALAEVCAQMHWSEPPATVLWGGGGVLPSLQKELPTAVAYAVRTGSPRTAAAQLVTPEFVVWAAEPGAALPPAEWQPRAVLDLNYREDSRAREYALAKGCPYFSGLTMFRAQAAAQRKLWHVETNRLA